MTHADRDGRETASDIGRDGAYRRCWGEKLENFGDAFLEVINGAAAEMHPTRRKLAGGAAGSVFDQLQEVQTTLSRARTAAKNP